MNRNAESISYSNYDELNKNDRAGFITAHQLPYFLYDLLIYLGSFILIFFIKEGHLEIFNLSVSYFVSYLAAWFIPTFLSRKLILIDREDFLDAAKPFFLSFFLTLGILSLSSILFNWFSISRYLVLGSLFLAINIELLWVGIKSWKTSRHFGHARIILSLRSFIIEFTIVSWVFLFIYFWKIGFSNLTQFHFLLLFGIYLSWFLASVFTHQFRSKDEDSNFWLIVYPYLKSYLIFLALLFFLIFTLRFTEFLRVLIIQGGVLYSLWSIIIITFFYLSRKPRKSDEVGTKIFKATEYVERETDVLNLPEVDKYSFPVETVKSDTLRKKLKNVYLKKFPEVFKILDQKIDLDSIDVTGSVVIRSADIYNVEVLPDNCLELFLNLHEMNDQRRLNAYFIEVNKRIKTGGLFISKFEPIKNRKQRFLNKYPYVLAQVFYLIDFIWRRVTPKLPVIQKFYFGLTKGRNRALSLAEGFGRLYYCGFEIISVFEVDNFVYFISKKVKDPSTDRNPSYGPLFKMRRVGKNGKPIFVYKFRTMHPYSEYLQKFVYDMHELKDGGKINNDFRVTYWGKILRKLWLDEFPMFINFFRRELKLVGVRPLSNHFLSLYDEELRKRRLNYKPGLVPPFYVDLPKTLKEIQLSEEKYLNEYDKHPLLTDIKYFYYAWYNIIVRKARSG